MFKPLRVENFKKKIVTGEWKEEKEPMVKVSVKFNQMPPRKPMPGKITPGNKVAPGKQKNEKKEEEVEEDVDDLNEDLSERRDRKRKDKDRRRRDEDDEKAEEAKKKEKAKKQKKEKVIPKEVFIPEGISALGLASLLNQPIGMILRLDLGNWLG